MKKAIYTLLLLTGITVTAGAQGFKTLPSGVQYQIITPNMGEKVKASDVVTFHVTQRTDKDSILFSSYKMGQPVKVQAQPSRNPGDLMDILPLLAAGDSAFVKIPVDTIFKGNDAQRPAFLAKGGNILCTIKVVQIQSLADAIAERNAGIAKLKAAEGSQGDAYIKKHGLVTKATPSGLRYVITKAGVGPKAQKGDSLAVNYAGRLTTEEVFDTSIESVAKAAGTYQQGRPYQPLTFVLGVQPLIAGWVEGLQLLNKGAKATFIIPSAIGYGEQGSGIIKPYSTLVFDVEMVNVIPGKHPVAKPKAATKGKTPLKKRPIVKKKN
ncbi:FKBP-type peptidyl-prolyl cis-trans isomerase [Mucilaginibacter sp. ZT4R22]|uniref:peptidylprolyl isomerase n=1 Tax=Mucilaginibacter pankratovii TaxID=2772110 RepID=A0ABR7WT84_9SPHI|nr:FKBP-type peptidyl-prolyl cis-trans isomerase [Mucilaginibacter pankratovii]MBD1365518.1 FKBP-type peptidyl-prolyl cis-trans isomerase [Mucilaginibacter pankratovii]